MIQKKVTIQQSELIRSISDSVNNVISPEDIKEILDKLQQAVNFYISETAPRETLIIDLWKGFRIEAKYKQSRTVRLPNGTVTAIPPKLSIKPKMTRHTKRQLQYKAI